MAMEIENFFSELAQVGQESNIDQNTLIEKVKSAMIKAAKRKYPGCEDIIRVEIDPKTKRFDMFLDRPVVADEDLMREVDVGLSEARQDNPNAQIGDIISEPLEINSLGRAEAQTAKQSFRGDLRDIQRDRVLEQFSDVEHKCITCQVTQVEPGGAVTMNYQGTEIYLFQNEQMPNETFREGQHVKVYITEIKNRQKNPVIKISRVRKELVGQLFEMEVPEIQEGIVEIRSISREAGFRSKVAVSSNDPNVDPVGACIGPKRSRISAVVRELGGEKIDLIPYSDDIRQYIAKALAPATIVSVDVLSEEEHNCIVTVPNNQLSLAIGNHGQNAKLAARLTGYKIDIKPETSLPVPDLPVEEAGAVELAEE